MSETARRLDEQVGPYKLIRAIGAGGSARIDLARIDRAYNFQRHVVVKRPLEHLRGDAAVAQSLRREARIAGRLRHPNLVAVLDAGVHDGYDYLVLEYVHGTSLRTLMQTEVGGRVRELPLPVALGIVIDVARALHEAHELTDERGGPLGLVHRDVSPGNVLLGLDGAVKLADFGIAKETRVSTLSGSMHGTVTYMAPEQCRGHAFDRRADLFSIGVILYELLTKQRLFWADNDVASLHRVLSGQVTPPRKLDASISPALETIVMMAVAQDPDGRFATARELGDALEALAAAEGHVVGARWLARTLEETVGPKHNPWIAASTIVEPIAAEGSLVAAIEDAGDGEIDPSFGPHDPRVFEEGEVPSSPVVTRKPVAAPKRRRWLLPATAVAVAGGIAIGMYVGQAHRTDPPGGSNANVAPPSELAKQPAIVPAPPPAPTAAPTDAADTAAVTDTTPTVTKPTKAHVKKAGHHQTTPPAAGSGSGSPVVAGPIPAAGSAAPPAQGSASRPANVEWKPTMLLPESGSNKKAP